VALAVTRSPNTSFIANSIIDVPERGAPAIKTLFWFFSESFIIPRPMGSFREQPKRNVCQIVMQCRDRTLTDRLRSLVPLVCEAPIFSPGRTPTSISGAINDFGATSGRVTPKSRAVILADVFRFSLNSARTLTSKCLARPKQTLGAPNTAYSNKL
jgi:hypothetical protein